MTTGGERFWSPGIGKLVPYAPGEQPRIDGLVKLNTNEHPQPPSPRVVDAITSAARQGLQLYPDPRSTLLREAIARYHGIDPDEVFVGNGSDEVLAHAFFAFFRQQRPLLVADVTYSFYRVYCDLYGINAEFVPLDAQLRLQVGDYEGRPAGGVVVANPNAPTGVALPLADIERLLRAHPDAVVLVDEAYVDFGADSAVPLVARYPNLLLVHTLSKSRSLAGLRVGCAIGQRHLVEALERVKDSFNSYPLDRLAQAGAVAAYEDEGWFLRSRKAVIDARESLAAQLSGLGFDVLPSAANFLFVRHPALDAAVLVARLRERRVLVRHFRQPRIEQYLRITVGTPLQCQMMVDALRGILVA
jgi:histidinol-phosphate aminotransferase